MKYLRMYCTYMYCTIFTILKGVIYFSIEYSPIFNILLGKSVMRVTSQYNNGTYDTWLAN